MPHETLPADIAEAIEALAIAAEQFGGQLWIATGDGAAVMRARAKLSATILSHLNGKAEEERTLSAIAGGAT